MNNAFRRYSRKSNYRYGFKPQMERAAIRSTDYPAMGGSISHYKPTSSGIGRPWPTTVVEPKDEDWQYFEKKKKNTNYFLFENWWRKLYWFDIWTVKIKIHVTRARATRGKAVFKKRNLLCTSNVSIFRSYICDCWHFLWYQYEIRLRGFYSWQNHLQQNNNTLIESTNRTVLAN